METEVFEQTRKAVQEKLGTHLVKIDFTGHSPFTDWFLICTALNQRMANSIVENVEEKLQHNGIPVRGIEGQDTNWVLMDLGEGILHVFVGETRQTYNLEKLWGDLPEVEIPE